MSGAGLRGHQPFASDLGPLRALPTQDREVRARGPRLTTALCWFRRNLRLDDNAALDAALRAADAVVPVFVLDDHYLTEDVSPPRLKVLADSLADLSRALERKGSRLVVRNGPPGPALVALAKETSASRVFAHHDREPYPLARDAAARRALEDAGARLVLVEDLYLLPPDAVTTAAGRPFTVFTPFSRRFREHDKPAPIPEPARVPAPASVLLDTFPTIALERPRAFRVPAPPGTPAGGESVARSIWKAFRERGLSGYAELRDRPDLPGTSGLSPHLRFGTIGPRRLLSDLREDYRRAPLESRRGIDAFVRELEFREFYASVLASFPAVATAAFRSGFEAFPWARGEEAGPRLAAWKAGLTGYPIVDAGMRQLLHEGVMHNRARMVVASFLTKDLLVDWREGERYFRGALADGDLASNVGGWQWAAGCGTDGQPFFRIFNPVRQGETFDPDGTYVKRWIPELSKVSAREIHRPWILSNPPKSYPPPIVDHAKARIRALAAFASMRAVEA